MEWWMIVGLVVVVVVGLWVFVHQRDPDAIGNDYLVLGTVDRPVWRLGAKEPLAAQDAMAHVHEFKRVLQFELAPRWGPA